MRATPRHAYPEHSTYRDGGCEYAPACLACPFPVCRYDADAEDRPSALARRDRDAEIVALVQAGHSKTELAKRFGVNIRQIWRVTEGLRT